MKALLQHSLEKIFPLQTSFHPPYTRATCLCGEQFSFQLALYGEEQDIAYPSVSVSLDSSAQCEIFQVECSPSMLPAYFGQTDDDYLSTQPGVFPDLLRPLNQDFCVVKGQWRSVWITVIPSQAGILHIHLFADKIVKDFYLDVLPVQLPKQKLLYTQWVYYDCLADAYHLDVFCDAYYDILKKYLVNAHHYGMNMLYVPIFTPPLENAVGSEKKTVQLIDVYEEENGQYRFSFDQLEKFIQLAKAIGFDYFEISHLFTQWGAGFAPKVMGIKDCQFKKLFGWETQADSPEYTRFLRTLLPLLKQKLKELNVFENTYFHISDEPEMFHMDTFKAAYDVVKDAFQECKVIDALSEVTYYDKGYVKRPVVGIDAIEPFVQRGVEHLWGYYCCCQNIAVSNRYFSMPSSRNRIIGQQLYQYGLEGFLHWGYNFWYRKLSKGSIDSFAITDAAQTLPSGDAFSVYPGEDGKPLPSIRQVVFNEALQDMRAMQCLESFTDKAYVMDVIKQCAAQPLTFKEYPKGSEYILSARERINEVIRHFA